MQDLNVSTVDITIRADGRLVFITTPAEGVLRIFTDEIILRDERPVALRPSEITPDDAR